MVSKSQLAWKTRKRQKAKVGDKLERQIRNRLQRQKANLLVGLWDDDTEGLDPFWHRRDDTYDPSNPDLPCSRSETIRWNHMMSAGCVASVLLQRPVFFAGDNEFRCPRDVEQQARLIILRELELANREVDPFKNGVVARLSERIESLAANGVISRDSADLVSSPWRLWDVDGDLICRSYTFRTEKEMIWERQCL